MGTRRNLLNPAVAAILAALLSAPVQAAASERVSELLAELAKPDQLRWQRVERQIIEEWSKSGSPVMDLLLKRGRDALEAGDHEAAIEHLTALIDHAPDFAEGYSARATAYYFVGAFGPAMEDIGRTLELNPDHFGALAGLGLILEETGFDRQALGALRAAHAIHPHHPSINRYLERLERRVAGHGA